MTENLRILKTRAKRPMLGRKRRPEQNWRSLKRWHSSTQSVRRFSRHFHDVTRWGCRVKQSRISHKVKVFAIGPSQTVCDSLRRCYVGCIWKPGFINLRILKTSPVHFGRMRQFAAGFSRCSEEIRFVIGRSEIMWLVRQLFDHLLEEKHKQQLCKTYQESIHGNISLF